MGLFKGKRKKKFVGKAITKILVLPMVMLFALMFAFFMFDDTWLYFQLLLFNNNGTNATGVTGGSVLYNKNATTGDGMGSVGFNNQGGGLNLALINQMSGGFFKDYLEIVRDHCNWTYMNKDWSPPSTNGTTWYPPITSVIGYSLNETTTEDIGGIRVPYTVVMASRYNEVEGYTLYKATSKWFGENGLSYVNPKYNQSTLKINKYYTQFQCTSNMFTLYPGTTVPFNNDDYTTRHTKPSLLNTGYGLTDGVTRGVDDRDGAYFPDQVSIALQSALKRYVEMCNVDKINLSDPSTAAYVAYAVHHLGSTGLFARGSTTLASNSPNSDSDVAAAATNQVGVLLEKALNYFTEHFDEIEASGFYFYDYGSYSGLGYAMLIKECGACFNSTSSQNKFLESVSGSSYWAKGVEIGAKIEGTTFDDIMALAKSSDRVKPSFGSGYGDNTYIYSEFTMFVLDSACQVIYKGKGTTVPVAHSWCNTDLRGMFQGIIGGHYVYMTMLKAGGVDCTFQQVVSSGDSLVEEIPTTGVDGGVDADSAGALLAYYGVLCSWDEGIVWDGKSYTSASIAEATWGPSLYIMARRLATPGNGYLRCCASFVAIMIGFSGIDADFDSSTASTRSTSNSLHNQFTKSDQWELVANSTTGNYTSVMESLKPGDVFLSSGHTMLYTGDYAKTYHKNINDVTSHDLCHASVHNKSETYGARSAKISSATYNLSNNSIEVWRCVKPDSLNGQTVLTSAEFNYLVENPLQNNTQFYGTNHSGGVTDKSAITIKTSG